MIRRILSTSVRIAIVGSALATPLMVGEANAQTALTIPPGLPEWTFNIPDKVQSSAVKPEGIVRAPGSAEGVRMGQGRGECQSAGLVSR